MDNDARLLTLETDIHHLTDALLALAEHDPLAGLHKRLSTLDQKLAELGGLLEMMRTELRDVRAEIRKGPLLKA